MADVKFLLSCYYNIVAKLTKWLFYSKVIDNYQIICRAKQKKKPPSDP